MQIVHADCTYRLYIQIVHFLSLSFSLAHKHAASDSIPISNSFASSAGSRRKYTLKTSARFCVVCRQSTILPAPLLENMSDACANPQEQPADILAPCKKNNIKNIHGCHRGHRSVLNSRHMRMQAEIFIINHKMRDSDIRTVCATIGRPGPCEAMSLPAHDNRPVGPGIVSTPSSVTRTRASAARDKSTRKQPPTCSMITSQEGLNGPHSRDTFVPCSTPHCHTSTDFGQVGSRFFSLLKTPSSSLAAYLSSVKTRIILYFVF